MQLSLNKFAAIVPFSIFSADGDSVNLVLEISFRQTLLADTAVNFVSQPSLGLGRIEPGSLPAKYGLCTFPFTATRARTAVPGQDICIYPNTLA